MNKSGFTIIELMVALLIGAVTITLIYWAWIWASEGLITLQDNLEASAKADQIFRILSNDSFESSSIIVKSDSLTFYSTNDTIFYFAVDTGLWRFKSDNVQLLPICNAYFSKLDYGYKISYLNSVDDTMNLFFP